MIQKIFTVLSAEASSAEGIASASGVNPTLGMIVMLAGFTAAMVVFAAFLTIVRKNKNDKR